MVRFRRRFRMNDITSTEKLLDLIRKGKGGPDASVPRANPSPAVAPRKRTRPAFAKGLPAGKHVNVGIDIGHEFLRLAKTERRSDSQWDLLDCKTVRFYGRVRKGTPEFALFLKEELNRFCGSDKKVDLWAIMSAANVSVRHIKIPKVPKNQIANAVFWSLKREQPFNEHETILDYEVLEETVEQGNPKWLVMAYTAPRAKAEETKALFAAAGLPLTGISIVPFAVQNIFRTGWIPKSDGTAAYLFIGNDFSRIDIYSKGNLIMTRGIKAGINSMAEALLEALQAEERERPALPEGRPAIDMEQARKVLFSLSPDFPGLAEGEAGYALTEEEKARIALPALDRLIRQVERTFEYYYSNVAQDRVHRIYVTSAMHIYPPAVAYVGEQLGIESDILDPLGEVLSGIDPNGPELNLSERITLTPALGMALADNAHTPNLLFTVREKQQIAAVHRVNRVIFSSLMVATLICAGLVLYQIGLIAKKQLDVHRAEQQLAAFNPQLKADDLLRMAAQSKQRQQALRAYGERYRGMAVIGELAVLTPAHIRFVNLKADFGLSAAQQAKGPPKPGEAAPEGGKAGSKEAPKEQAAAAKAGHLVVEGIVSGDRLSLESSLAGYLVKLQESPLFRQVSVQKNGIERVQKKEVLRFTISMQVV